MAYRIGNGSDFHAFGSGRDLVLGGIRVPHDKGLEGHSDADVLTHALCDALLGAACLGDIGCHFPDTNPAYRGISSLKLLARVMELLRGRGFTVENADITVILQEPRLAPFREAMEKKLAGALDCSAVNIKATTTEGMGFAGRGEGIETRCSVLLKSRS